MRRVEPVDPREVGQPAHQVHLRAQRPCAEHELTGSGLGAADVLVRAEHECALAGADRSEVIVLVDQAESRGAVRLTPTR